MVALREVAGWMLVGAGLAAFVLCYVVFLLSKQTLQAVVLGFFGFTVFRGGVHVLKVAMAARLAREADRPARNRVV